MKKPIILISASNINAPELLLLTGDTEIIYSDKASAEAIVKAGGLPIFIPSISSLETSDLVSYLDFADGMLLTGADTNTSPFYYGESPAYLKGRVDDERDKIDIELVKISYKKKIPILGICKGMQVLNVALGGSLYQNIKAQCDTCFNHDVTKTKRSNITHTAKFIGKSMLKNIFGQEVLKLNGGHQQAVKRLPNKLKEVAKANDGIIEAFEGKREQFVMGIQFHAELRLFDKPYFNIFKLFIEKSKN